MSANENGSMRDKMPGVTAFIDECRDAFGAAEVNSWIREGLKDGSFWAEENGHTVGVKQEMTGDRTSLAQWLKGSDTIERDEARRQANERKEKWYR
ncbi:hypothetical protein [Candidatus Nitrotoga sp. M5]|uniref:hypothetical protein n=1 Tax=Candidatus Nitrotoga sp. M5 TaxID=2890409 RepID=UPI001EF6A21A|nr:hypothetical protein [Candidatus Nitrotoga sp. M5]CAH1387042.1 hypothetical protein NTGM5_480038 [Candidatus Nitrotoga sp. M5]